MRSIKWCVHQRGLSLFSVIIVFYYWTLKLRSTTGTKFRSSKSWLMTFALWYNQFMERTRQKGQTGDKGRSNLRKRKTKPTVFYIRKICKKQRVVNKCNILNRNNLFIIFQSTISYRTKTMMASIKYTFFLWKTKHMYIFFFVFPVL